MFHYAVPISRGDAYSSTHKVSRARYLIALALANTKIQEGGQGEILDNSVCMLPADHSFIIGIVKNLRHDPGYASS